jgi:hypothetical protein
LNREKVDVNNSEAKDKDYKMAMMRENNYHHHISLSFRYGVVLSAISLLSIFSILAFYGKLQMYVSVASNTTANIDINNNNNNNNNNYYLNDEVNNVNYRDRKLPEVAWLMSFPNSGTTYTNHLIQDYTNTTTATNYGHEQSTKETSISVLPNSTDGPFFRYPTWTIPPAYILTKTHCGGECDSCHTPGSKEYNDTIDAFEVACCSGKRIFNNTKVKTTYSLDIPKRAVHLIRNPFDNIVARLHLKERRWARFEGKDNNQSDKYEERLDLFNNTKEGFHAYCKFRDKRSFKQEMRYRLLNDTLLDYAKDVPCYAEFITYTKWHNHAIQLVEKKGIPVLTLFYEDYASDWDENVNRLLSFLLLSPANDGTATEFILGKQYDEFYVEKEKLAAIKLIQALASSELWDLLQRYL